MATSTPKDMDEYIAGFAPSTQHALNEIRETIKRLIPEAEETISYAIPCVKLEGKYLVYFAGYKNHIGIYPVPTKDATFDKDFAGYKTSGKGALQLPLDKPMPLELIAKIVRFRVKENRDKAEKKKTIKR